MLGGDLDVGAFKSPLQQGPEVLNAVDVDPSDHVSSCMINDAMVVVAVKPGVRAESVRVDGCAFLDLFTDHLVESPTFAVGYYGGLEIAAPFPYTNDGRLVLATRTGNFPLTNIAVHVLGEAANERLIDLNLA